MDWVYGAMSICAVYMFKSGSGRFGDLSSPKSSKSCTGDHATSCLKIFPTVGLSVNLP
jgi:hypothetical protein